MCSFVHSHQHVLFDNNQTTDQPIYTKQHIKLQLFNNSKIGRELGVHVHPLPGGYVQPVLGSGGLSDAVRKFPFPYRYTTEVYFDGWGVENQYNWISQDLQWANAKENRSVRPWIIVYGHRPMYCSTLDGDDCTTSKSVVRAG